MAAWTDDPGPHPDPIEHVRAVHGLLWGLLFVTPAWGLVIVAAFLVGYAIGAGWR